ncbi:Glucan endo-1,3-beta-glucosidase-like protein [Quillaja saponaria]|uniref:glucan endo-1,3-beta-D-glucosidase n=1 Tax=Quillaja saponaria TaxID=32244 RepID=A0AAD7KT80_QUISA|nr:Glucan endo-1,3-beta-glucosidase-like protein [Quillaja saponaria]
MARAEFLLGAFCVLIMVSFDHAQGADGIDGIGVNWGNIASHPLDPHIVVNMLKDNKIKKLKLFDADSWTVSALAGTGIEVMLGIPNDQLKRFANDYGDCKDWVKENVTKHIYDGGVNIRYVAVGNEPFLKAYNGSNLKTTFPAVKNIQKALDEAGHGDKIKVTVPLNADVYESGSDKPSDGRFRKDTEDIMIQMVKFFNDNKSPFVVNIYPFLSLFQNPDFPKDFAFFDGAGKPIQDRNLQYTNVFDANHDTLVWALKRAGVPNLKITVGEVGWPTDGDKNANPELAQKFYSGFLKRMVAKKGTPLRPGPMDVYLFGLLDEDMKSVAPGHFERHWGIFRYDGQPKFHLDFTGQGRAVMPVGAKGVQYQDKKWCVFNKDIKNLSLVPKEIAYACAQSDCTSLGYGCSCQNLDMLGNVSYAFNMYFQMNDQSVEACHFNGLAKIVTDNATKGECLFPIQIVSSGEMLKVMIKGSAFLVGLFLSFITIM